MRLEKHVCFGRQVRRIKPFFFFNPHPPRPSPRAFRILYFVQVDVWKTERRTGSLAFLYSGCVTLGNYLHLSEPAS